MSGFDKWKEQAHYWKGLPVSATVVLLSGIFCLFAALGLMVGIMNVAGMTVNRALAGAIIIGSFAIGYAFGGFRAMIWLLIGLFPLQIAVNVVLGRLWASGPNLTASAADHRALLLRLQIEGGLAMAMIIAGYALIVLFMRKEGVRVFGAMTEMRLASEVHRTLVPPFSRRVGDYEMYGSSIPTGQVGGDLVDLIEAGGRWEAYVADVSGHGVPAGMTMAMVKSAAHMGSTEGKPLSVTLSELNSVFSSLSAPNVFVTFACIAGNNGPELTFALAGHLPILHYRKRDGRVEERSVSNFPLAIMPDADFATASLTCEPGDVLAILTDGLTEAADKEEHELGLEPLKAVFLESAAASLEQIANRLRATALKQGPQSDDQTVLLVRRIPIAQPDRTAV